MSVIFYILAALLIYLSYKSLRGGVDYLNFFKNELAKPPSGFTPFASVIAPCKGVDEGMAENLNALLVQNYPGYEVLFVLDDISDPAAVVIEEISRNSAKPTKLIVAPKSTNSSQKVENLREAVLHIDERSEIFVFVDSDARPNSEWLGSLVAPLADEHIGASTGYRWFFSEKLTIAGELRSSWNASIASALGPNTSSNFCWGGSMAIRRDTFDKLHIREKWKGTLSDDFTVTRAMNAASQAVYFVPQALTPSIESCSPRGLFEFTNRQMKITRVYASKLWLLSFFGSGLFNLVIVWSAVLFFVAPAFTTRWIAAAVTLLSVSLFSIWKAWLRLNAVRLALPSHAAEIDRQFLPQLALWLFTPAIFLINSAAALMSTRIKWRGVDYQMISPTETRLKVRD